MTYKEIANMINSIGPPSAYYQFPEGTAQPTPFICFYYPNDNDFVADNSNYQKIEHLVIELYTDNISFEEEAAVEAVLLSHGFVWARNRQWIDSERMHETIYEMDVVINPETTPNTEG